MGVLSALLAAFILFEIEASAERECWDGCDATRYNGTVSVTSNGLPCEPWADHFAVDSEVNGDTWAPEEYAAYCRDPNVHVFYPNVFQFARRGQPWCMVLGPIPQAQPCDIPVCEYRCCYDPLNASLYTGPTNVSMSGLPCQFWSSQSPNRHRFTEPELFPDKSVDEAMNFCRDPDGSGQPWCYVTEGPWRRENCHIPKCNQHSYRCGGVLTDEAGWFSFSVSKVGEYHMFSMLCHWTLIAPMDKRIQLTSQSANPDTTSREFDCTWDITVSIYDGYTRDDPLIAEICGLKQFMDLTSTSNALFVNITHTLRLRWEESRAIFNVTFTHVYAPKPINTTLNTGVGWFGPVTDEYGQYDNNVDFRWTIVPDSGHVVQLFIFDINIIDESDFYTTPDLLELIKSLTCFRNGLANTLYLPLLSRQRNRQHNRKGYNATAQQTWTQICCTHKETI